MEAQPSLIEQAIFRTEIEVQKTKGEEKEHALIRLDMLRELLNEKRAA